MSDTFTHSPNVGADKPCLNEGGGTEDFCIVRIDGVADHTLCSVTFARHSRANQLTVERIGPWIIIRDWDRLYAQYPSTSWGVIDPEGTDVNFTCGT